MKKAFVVVALLATVACGANKAPTLSPVGQQGVLDLQVVKALDVIRDTAIALNAQTPPLLATKTTREIVDFHESAVKIITTAPHGWKPTVLTALDQLQQDLPGPEWARVQPYVLLLRTLIDGVS